MPPIPPPRLRRVINAWGTATPFGVSRSPAAVAEAVAVAPHRVAQGQLGLELTGVDADELPLLSQAMAAALGRR